MPLGRKLEPELANRNHASGVQKVKTGKPAAEYLGDLLRVCLRGWVLLKLSGDTASGCPPHTTGSTKVGGRGKMEGSVLEAGREVLTSCSVPPTPSVCVCAVQSLCMALASCKEEGLMGASYIITDQAVEGVFGANRQ